MQKAYEETKLCGIAHCVALHVKVSDTVRNLHYATMPVTCTSNLIVFKKKKKLARPITKVQAASRFWATEGPQRKN